MIPIVAIGTSAGGLKEIEIFFKNMPKSKEVAFVIIQHLSPHHKSILAEIVTHYTDMDVSQIKRKTKVRAGKVYIIPPNKLLSLEDGKLILSPFPREKSINLPIDVFFRSMKKHQREKSVAVILSGTGSDGTLGIQDVKEGGGLCIVQDPSTADYDGMPLNAMKTGLIDYVVPVEKMPSLILEYIQNNYLNDPILKNNDARYEKLIQKIFKIIKAQTGNDFSQYKRNTIIRRIERRLTINKCKTLSNYVDLLESNNSEIITLSKEFLISVTSFFRDKEVFEKLKNEVIPSIVKNSNQETLRIWVPACATGEEAFSLAILVKDYLDKQKLNIDLQVFASDVDNEAIERARECYYPKNIATDIDDKLLSQYFVKEGDGFKVKKSLRESVIFAEQNLLQDPPYSKIDLISCRNLLIYLDTDIQAKAISIFNYALIENGVLVLGNSESLGNFKEYFNIIDRKLKIYKKATTIDLRGKVWTLNFNSGYTKQVPEKKLSEPISKLAQNYLLDEFTPPSVVIDYNGNMIYVQGKTGNYLENTTGEFSNDIVRNAREGIKIPLSNAIRKAKSGNKKVRQEKVRVKVNEEYQFINLNVIPLKRENKDTKLLMVIFQPIEAPKSHSIKEANENYEQTALIELEKELEEKEQYLQNTIEELETTNEELKSSNEEAQSTNEELQSTNEELETSKEELQSVNEELTTTNNELNHKLDELYTTNNNLQNLLDATNIATIFLDKDLKIFNYTPSISNIIELLKSDIGRSVKQFTYNLNYTDLIKDANNVLKTLVPKETEVKSKDNKYFWMRISPYRTTDDKIEGLVITFTDITEKKKIEEKLRLKNKEIEEHRKFLSDIISNIDVSILVVEVEKKGRYKFLASNQIEDKLINVDNEYIIGRYPEDLKNIIGDKIVNFVKFIYDQCVAQKKGVSGEFFAEGQSNGEWWYFRVSPIFDDKKGEVKRIISSSIKISELKATQIELEEYKQHLEDKITRKTNLIRVNEEKFRHLFENLDEEIHLWKIVKDKDGSIKTWELHDINPIALKAWNKSKEDVIGKRADDIFNFDTTKTFLPIVNKIFETGKPHRWEKYFAPTKQYLSMESVAYGEYFMSIGRDISDRKKAEEELKASEAKFRKLFENTPNGIAICEYEENNNETPNDFKIREINDSTIKILNLKPSDLIGKNGSELADLKYIKKMMDVHFKSLSEGNQCSFEFYFKKAGRLLSISTFNLNKSLFIINFYDITEKKQKEKELVLAKQRAEENDKLKSAFLANMSHEIRTPMNAVLGFSSLLKKEGLAKSTRDKYIEMIQMGSNQLLRLINDIIDISKIEAGQMSIFKESIHLNELFISLQMTFNQSDGIKNNPNLDITTNIPKDFEKITLYTDGVRLQQVMGNFISNSIRYSEKGTIEIGFDVNENEYIELYVKDEGIGISKENQKKIFNRFEQLGPTNNEVIEGTGLGLPISSGITKLLGGEIILQSEHNEGSRFSVKLPWSEVVNKKRISHTSKKKAKNQSVSNNEISILIVDDAPFNIELFKEYFKEANFRILTASNGKEAVAKYFDDGQINIVLMDIKMPIMDGLEAAKQILKRDPDAKIIAQTAFAAADDRAKFIEQGFFDYIAKPIDKELLLSMINQLMNA